MNNFTFGVIRSYRKCSSLFLLMASVVCLFVAGCATSNISVAVHDTTSTFDTVVVDAGHGGKDSGVFKGGIAEKVAALDVAQRLDKKLRAAGFHTVMTRNGDYFVELNERAAISNRQENAIFVSIHFNDSRKRQINGVDTYYNSPVAEPLARSIEQSLSKIAPARGIHHANYRVLRKNKYPAVLVECGFLSNGRDASEAKSAAYREKLATQIVLAIKAQRGE